MTNLHQGLLVRDEFLLREAEGSCGCWVPLRRLKTPSLIFLVNVLSHRIVPRNNSQINHSPPLTPSFFHVKVCVGVTLRQLMNTSLA